MKLIYYSGSDTTLSTGSYIAVYSDFTGTYSKWYSNYDQVDESNSLTDEQIFLIIKGNNLSNLLTHTAFVKYNKMKSA